MEEGREGEVGKEVGRDEGKDSGRRQGGREEGRERRGSRSASRRLLPVAGRRLCQKSTSTNQTCDAPS